MNIGARLAAAGIPKVGQRTTLEQLGQTVLRAVVNDATYRIGRELQSISILQGPGTPDEFFELVCSRFAIELCLTDAPVLYATVSGLKSEIRRYESGADSVYSEFPYTSHAGLFVVSGWDVVETQTAKEVAEFLIQRMGYGAGIMSLQGSRDGGEAFRSTRLHSILHSAVKVSVSPPANRPSKR